MGQEIECTLRHAGRSFTGKAYLETDHLRFRGDERLKVLLKDVQKVSAAAGVLTLDFPGGPAELELGKAAEKWAQKILHPPSRLHKLGVKPGSAIKLIGKFDDDFVREIRAAATARTHPDLLFFAAEKSADLTRVPDVKPGQGLWVIYPKGVAAIREADVLEAGRAAGLKDVKVVAFSSTHTGLKFVK
jgi:hypothetical protein